MGAATCGAGGRVTSTCRAVGETCSPSAPSRCYRNTRAVGRGGPLVSLKGRVACLVVAFDYEGYPAEERAGCGPLYCVASGRRFADLAGASRAEVLEFYDQPGVPGSLGFPEKDRVLTELGRLARSLGAGDALIFYFAGRGAKASRTAGGAAAAATASTTPVDELCFVRPDGSPDFLQSGEIAALLSGDFSPQTRVLFVTDCCHSGNVCDLTREEFNGRPMCHLAGVRDGQSADSPGDYCAFTGLLLETVRDFVRHGEAEFSVINVFNSCFARYEDMPESQEVCFERAGNFDPDTFAWPLVPTWGWEVGAAVAGGPLDAVKKQPLQGDFARPDAVEPPAKTHKAAHVTFDLASVDCIHIPMRSGTVDSLYRPASE